MSRRRYATAWFADTAEFVTQAGRVAEGDDRLGDLAGLTLAEAVARIRTPVWRINPFDPEARNIRWNQEGRVVCLRRQDFDVYIGRLGHGHDHAPGAGIFGNPIRRGSACAVCGEVHRMKGSTLDCYEQWLRVEVERNSRFREQVAELVGLRLGCFCAPGKPCHGHILYAAAEEIGGDTCAGEDGLDSIMALLAKVDIAT